MAEKDIKLHLQVDGTREAVEAIRQTKEELRGFEESAARTAENTEKIQRLEAAKTIADIAEGVGDLGRRLIHTADNIELFDSELAGTVRTAGQATEAIAGTAQAAAMGFAVGGPAGAAVAAMAKMVGDLAQAWMDNKAAVAEAEAEMEQRLRETNAALAERHSELAAEEWEEWIASLDEGRAALERQNAALDRNVALLEAKRRAQMARGEAEDEKELAEIEADPNLSEEEKIKRRVGVRERGERRRAQGQLDQINETVAGADREAADARREAQRKSGNVDTIRREMESDAKTIREQEEIARTADRAEGDLPGMREALERARAKNTSREAKAMEVGTLEREIARLGEEAAAGYAARKAVTEARTRLEKAEKESLPEAEKEEAGARENAGAAASRRDFIRERSEIEAGAIIDTYQTRRQTRATRTESEISRHREREEAKKRREEEARRRKEEQEEEREKGLGREAGGIATQAAGIARTAGANGAFVKRLEDAGKKVADDPAAKEMEELLKAVGKLADGIEAREGRSSSLARDISKLADRLGKVEGQIKRSRDGR